MALRATTAAIHWDVRTVDAVKPAVSVAGSLAALVGLVESPGGWAAALIFVALVLLYFYCAMRRLSCLPVIEWGRFRLRWTRQPEHEDLDGRDVP